LKSGNGNHGDGNQENHIALFQWMRLFLKRKEPNNDRLELLLTLMSRQLARKEVREKLQAAHRAVDPAQFNHLVNAYLDDNKPRLREQSRSWLLCINYK